MLIIGIVALSLLVAVTLVWFAYRAGKAETEIIAMRAQVGEVPLMRQAVSSLASQVSSLATVASAQQSATMQLVGAITAKRVAEREAMPPPKSSGVRRKARVHYVEAGTPLSACLTPIDDITLASGSDEYGWTSDLGKVSCVDCIDKLAVPSDGAETAVMSRRPA